MISTSTKSSQESTSAKVSQEKTSSASSQESTDDRRSSRSRRSLELAAAIVATNEKAATSRPARDRRSVEAEKPKKAKSSNPEVPDSSADELTQASSRSAPFPFQRTIQSLSNSFSHLNSRFFYLEALIQFISLPFSG